VQADVLLTKGNELNLILLKSIPALQFLFSYQAFWQLGYELEISIA